MDELKTTAQLYFLDLQKLRAIAAADGKPQRDVLHDMIERAFATDPEAQAIYNRRMDEQLPSPEAFPY